MVALPPRLRYWGNARPVSRSIQRLEARLGVKLFHRTTRSVRLTHDGELYREQCQQALEQIAEAERAITGRQRHPRGVLRISVGTVYAHHRLVPLLPGFMAAYPEVELELNVSNRNIDFVEDGLSGHPAGEPRDGRIIARKLEDASLGVFCTPDYAARRPAPTSLEMLSQHDLIQFITPSTGRPFPWQFVNEQGTLSTFMSRADSGCLTMCWRAWAGRWLGRSVPDLPFRGSRGAVARQADRGDDPLCGAIPPFYALIHSTVTSRPGSGPSWIICWQRCTQRGRLCQGNIPSSLTRAPHLRACAPIPGAKAGGTLDTMVA